MERRRPITNITEHPLVSAREDQINKCLDICDEAKRRLDDLRDKAKSGNIESAKQLETEGPLLEERIREHTERASRLIETPLS